MATQDGSGRPLTVALFAGDVASEGVNLHRQCNHLIHYDIPWSLIRIEQRNGGVPRVPWRASPAATFAGTSSWRPVPWWPQRTGASALAAGLGDRTRSHPRLRRCPARACPGRRAHAAGALFAAYAAKQLADLEKDGGYKAVRIMHGGIAEERR